jgi:hypothetical protein
MSALPACRPVSWLASSRWGELGVDGADLVEVEQVAAQQQRVLA